MLPLRYARAWLAAGLALLLIVLGLALLPVATAGPVFLLPDKVLHFLTFLVLMVWFCGVFERRWMPAVALEIGRAHV